MSEMIKACGLTVYCGPQPHCDAASLQLSVCVLNGRKEWAETDAFFSFINQAL